MKELPRTIQPVVYRQRLTLLSNTESAGIVTVLQSEPPQGKVESLHNSPPRAERSSYWTSRMAARANLSLRSSLKSFLNGGARDCRAILVPCRHGAGADTRPRGQRPGSTGVRDRKLLGELVLCRLTGLVGLAATATTLAGLAAQGAVRSRNTRAGGATSKNCMAGCSSRRR